MPISALLSKQTHHPSIISTVHQSSLACEDMVVGSFKDEHVSSFPPPTIWKATIVDAHNTLPKLLSCVIASVEIEGDGGVGSIRKLTFTPAVKEFTYVKNRIDVLDDENFVFKYTVVEGGFLGLKLKSYSFLITFEPAANGGSVAKLTVEYDTIDGQTLTEEDINAIKGSIKGFAMAIDGYLRANPGAYA